jgi:hypothetical protein
MSDGKSIVHSYTLIPKYSLLEKKKQRHSAGQEFSPRFILCNTEFDCRVQKYTPVYSILSQLNPIRTFTVFVLDVV